MRFRRTAPEPRRPRRAGVFALAAVLAALLTSAADAARWNWSGSVTLDYKSIPGVPDEELAKSGAIVQWSQKATVDVSEKLSASARLCTACHGVTVNHAYAELRLTPLLNIDAGRLEVPFGDYTQRHDPANDTFLSTPLPYAMGHMLRYQSDRFNLGVVPVPYVDEGAALFGDVWIHDTLQIWYSVYGTNGFQSSVARDFTFKNQLGDGGYSDNNDELAWGARVALARGALTAGASYLRGAYDPVGNFDYNVWGVDASAYAAGVQLRAEYVARETDVLNDAGAAATLWKKGFYVQAESPAVRHVALVGRFDGVLREGPSLGTNNDESSAVVRWTAGFNVMPTLEYSLRFQYERWRFTDFDDNDVMHFGIVASY